MSLRAKRSSAKVTGILHQTLSSINTGRSTSKESAVEPHVSLFQNGFEYIETILQGIRIVPEGTLQAKLEDGGLYWYGREWRPAGFTPAQTGATEPYYVISGYIDQNTKATGSWIINFVLGRTPKDQRLVTLLDQTNSAVLFTAQLPPVSDAREASKVVTPLERFIQNPEGVTGLWGAILDDGDEL